MKLSKFSDENLIQLHLKSKTKAQVISELVELVSRSTIIKDAEMLKRDILEREELVTTGIGYGVAFPHAKTSAAKSIVIAFGRCEAGLDFDAIDRKPVQLFYLIAAPEDAIGAHLNVMARLSYLMKSEENRAILLKATSPGEVLTLMDHMD
jgi:fructose-specific phosphotransferase system IIA component